MRFGGSAIATACALLLMGIGVGAATNANAEAGGPFAGTSTPDLPDFTRLAQIKPRGKLRAPPHETSAGLPAPSTACAAAYHKALSEIRDGFAARVELAHRHFHDVDPELPGRWLFTGQSSFAMPATAAAWFEDNTSCVAPLSRGARARCKRWDVQDGGPSAIRWASPLPTEDERRLFRSLADFVRARGAVPEQSKNGRPTWVTQRVAGELNAYVGQPAHPALCSGAVEILDFYVGHLDGFRKHMKAVADLDAKARGLAKARVAAAKGAVNPPAATVVGFSPRGFSIGTAVSTYREMILETAGVLLPAEQITHIKAETATLAMLTRAAEAMSMDAIQEQQPVLRDMVTAAFRVIEAGTYAEILLGRHQELEAALLGKIEQIREAHKTSCTCAE